MMSRSDRKALLAILLGLILVSAPVVRVMASGEAEEEDADVDDEGDYDDDEDGPDDVNVDDDDDDLDDDDDDDADDGAKDKKDPEAAAEVDGEGKEGVYVAPASEGAFLLETFQGSWEKSWVKSSQSKYNGEWAVGVGKKAILPGDKGLIVTKKARHYGISAPLKTGDLKGKSLSIQYEVKFDEGVTCSGAYLKFPTEPFADLSKFDNDVKYSIMFGPDKCGGTSKVHFIFQSKNPKSKEYVEHHLKNPPSVPTSKEEPHLFTLNVDGDSFEVLVDGESKATGKLSEDFEPPVQPLAEIDDSEDKKPDDWVDAAKIADPEAVKPDDWDEEAPKEIPDEDAVKPEGWLDDEPDMIPDPSVKKPEEWDVEEDGEWEAPLIPNPKCEEAGCGEWKRPSKANPDYKGKWKAPMIDNPEYKGPWKPRKIPNPAYYKVESIGLLPITAAGIEIWTMDQGIIFDNLLITDSASKAKEFADATYGAKKKAYEQSKPKPKDKKKSAEKVLDKAQGIVASAKKLAEPVDEMLDRAGLGPVVGNTINLAVKKPVLASSVSVLGIVMMMLLCCAGGKKSVSAPEKKTDAVQPDDKDVDNTSAAGVTPIESAEKANASLRQRKRAE